MSQQINAVREANALRETSGSWHDFRERMNAIWERWGRVPTRGSLVDADAWQVARNAHDDIVWLFGCRGEACEVCFFVAWEPCPESECEWQHPHRGTHIRCGHCRLREQFDKLRNGNSTSVCSPAPKASE